jgi:antitoxin YobK
MAVFLDPLMVSFSASERFSVRRSMSSQVETRLKRIFERCRNAGPASAEQIEAAEEALAVRFPPSFRAFLSLYGASWFHSPYEISGIGPEIDSDGTPEWTSVTLTTQQARRMGQSAELIALTSDGCDCHIYLDSGHAREDGEYPVVVLAPGFDRVRIAESFVEFAELPASVDSFELHG